MSRIVIAYRRHGPAGETVAGTEICNGFKNPEAAFAAIRGVAQKRRVQPEELAVFQDGVHVPHPRKPLVVGRFA